MQHNPDMRQNLLSQVLWLASLALALAGCTKQASSKATATELSLIRASLADRINAGQLASDAFCDQPVPYVYIFHADIDFQCINDRFHWKITEERGDQAQRSLRNKAGQELRLNNIASQRYRLRGSPCPKGDGVYVRFKDAKNYRQRWLQHARCPAQDMKLAD